MNRSSRFVFKIALAGMFTAVAVVGSMLQFPVFGSQCAPVQHMVNVLCAVAVVGSMLQFPVFGSQCAPVQHMVNVICAVFLGPGYGVAVAFLASLLRNLFHLGSLLAFPGSMCGALLCGLMYWKTKNLPATLCAEVFGTGIIGGLLSYPIAIAFMGVVAGSIAFYAYVVPFLISTVAGSILAGALVFALKRSGALKTMQTVLEH